MLKTENICTMYVNDEGTRVQISKDFLRKIVRSIVYFKCKLKSNVSQKILPNSLHSKSQTLFQTFRKPEGAIVFCKGAWSKNAVEEGHRRKWRLPPPHQYQRNRGKASYLKILVPLLALSSSMKQTGFEGAIEWSHALFALQSSSSKEKHLHLQKYQCCQLWYLISWHNKELF